MSIKPALMRQWLHANQKSVSACVYLRIEIEAIMFKTLKLVLAAYGVATLVACGGGGGGTSQPSATVLEGTWIAATGGHKFGGGCGLDPSGNYEIRQVFDFKKNAFQLTVENCVVLTGNTGFFVLTQNTSGNFSIGSEFVIPGITIGGTVGNPIVSTNGIALTELNLTAPSGATAYTSFKIASNNLSVSIQQGHNDGSTAAKRMINCCDSANTFAKVTADATATLSVTQQNFESAVLKSAYTVFDWFVPGTNVAPVSGVNYFYTLTHSILASPSGGVVADSVSTENLTAGMLLPDLTHRNVNRTLKNGVVYVSNYTTKIDWSYKNSNVVQTIYATDGVTPTEVDEFDSWTTPTSLSGQIASSAILKSYLGYSRLNTPLNFDFTKNWLAGSSYITRKGFYQADILEMYDWTGTTYGAGVTAYTGPEATIETFFNQPTFSIAGGYSVDSTLYNLADGSISNMQGARVWVATNKRPQSAFATDNYLAIIELNGKIFVGGLRKANTRFKSIDGVDSTIVHDDMIRLNTNAANSIKQTLKF